MPYLLNNVMFIHIPKTGGHSVWDVMRQHGGTRMKDSHGDAWTHHATGIGLKQRLGGSYDHWTKFSLVRNPWQRAVGLYYGRDKLKEHTPARFEKWLDQWRTMGKLRWNPYYPQSRLLTTDVTVFRLENIEECYDWMEEQFDIKIVDPKHIKTGKHRYVERLPWRDYFSRRHRRAIGEAHKVDIYRWGWQFG
jgi:hypothetical protein